jgi:RimJ/RimL family protein N-acetyltransferase
MHALLKGDLAKASEAAGVELDEFYREGDVAWLWKLRTEQIAADPASENWLANVVVHEGTAVGHAGFHGPPDANGMVEIGYTVAPQFRRQGYGTAIVDALITRAASEKDVTTVRASISPDNAASLATIAPYGFERTGEQIDEVDGLEWIFERAARQEQQ